MGIHFGHSAKERQYTVMMLAQANQETTTQMSKNGWMPPGKTLPSKVESKMGPGLREWASKTWGDLSPGAKWGLGIGAVVLGGLAISAMSDRRRRDN